MVLFYHVYAVLYRWSWFSFAESGYTETEPAADLPVLALSTCAVDFGDARALFTGRLVRIRGISPADTA